MICPFRKITTTVKYPERCSGYKLYFAQDVVTESFADCLCVACPCFIPDTENYCRRVDINEKTNN